MEIQAKDNNANAIDEMCGGSAVLIYLNQVSFTSTDPI